MTKESETGKFSDAGDWHYVGTDIWFEGSVTVRKFRRF